MANERMQPGGDSAHTASIKLYRLANAISSRNARSRHLGFTVSPVVGRGLLVQNDGTDDYITMTDLLLKGVKGIGGTDGYDLVFSEDFDAGDGDSDLLDAYQTVSAGDCILHQGRLHVKTTDGMETLDGQCIMNGSFENLDESGWFEFWTEST